MGDVHNSEIRSKNMRAIRAKNTAPEMRVRKLLFARGFRFRLHVRDLPGAPDIVLPKYRVALFVHGCFWHGHGCHLFKLPATRRDFWDTKIQSNRVRDIRDIGLLQAAGWRVICVWECALKGRFRLDEQLFADTLAEGITAPTSANVLEFQYCPFPD